MSGKPFSLRTGAFNRRVSIRCAFKEGVQTVLGWLVAKAAVVKGDGWAGYVPARPLLRSLANGSPLPSLARGG